MAQAEAKCNHGQRRDKTSRSGARLLHAQGERFFQEELESALLWDEARTLAYPAPADALKDYRRADTEDRGHLDKRVRGEVGPTTPV